ncbi:MAG: acetylornithine/succinylornithine family transaminase [Tenericutes bacterium]|nr:acetylornithine/succinylornithine family transaminase [Mycoplasmatota bacterium]
MSNFNLDQKYILNTYKRLPIEIKKGRGSYLYDIHNKKYLDMYAGIAVSSLGHHHPKIIKAIKKQSKDHLHLSNYFVFKSSSLLAQKLVEHSFASKVFFTNSGTEAIEAALKLVRKYGKSINASKTKVIALDEAFHGRTYGGLSLTGQPKYQEAFKPLVPDIIHIERNNIKALEQVVSSDVCAIFIEMIQGESGIQSLSDEFIEAISKYSIKHEILVVADEIQTGLLRTGKLFAYEHTNLTPDLLTLAKSLGGGLPLGALLVSKKLENVLKPGDHGTTFGGNPLSCATGLAVINELTKPEMILDVYKKSGYLFEQLKSIKNKYPIISEIRGSGLMIGIEVGDKALEIQQKALELGVLLNVTNQTVIRLLPPLNIQRKELDEFINIFENVLKTI